MKKAVEAGNQNSLVRTEVREWFANNTIWIERSEETLLGLDRGYIICTENRVEHVQRFIKKNRFEGRVSVLRAFTPDRVDLDELIELQILSPHFKKRGKGQTYEIAACICLSHFACYLESELTEADRLIIFEDDLRIVDESQKASRLIEEASSLGWDLLYFSYCHLSRSEARSLTKNLFQFPGALCTTAYAVSVKGRRSLLGTALPFRYSIDQYLCKKAEAATLVAIGAKETLFSQDRENVDSSFGNLRRIGPPIWAPSFPQKLLSRLYSVATRTGRTGYDQAILDLDSFRRGELEGHELNRPLIRSWALWARMRNFSPQTKSKI